LSTRWRSVITSSAVVLVALSSAVLAIPGAAAVGSSAPPTVAAGATPTKTPGSATSVGGGAIEIGIGGSVGASAHLTLGIPCETAPALLVHAARPGTATTTWGAAATVGASSDGQCGAGVVDLLTVSWTTGSSSATGNAVSVLPFFDLTQVPSGSITLNGVYVSSVGLSDFTVSDLTVVNPSAAGAAPLSTVAPGTGDVAERHVGRRDA
jgi:hypothetical protein